MEDLNLSPLKVLIADDHPLILAGLHRVLERSDDIEVVGEAASGPELLALIERRRPQLVLTDLRMPGVCGAASRRSGRDGTRSTSWCFRPPKIAR
jgi:DNA-binding NarL/FixJ family response regulator